MTDMSNFKKLLLDYYKTNKKLPNVDVKSSCTLNEALDALSYGTSVINEPGMSKRNEIAKYVDMFDAAQNDDSFNRDAFDMINQISEIMTEKILSTKGELSSIKGSVEALSENIVKCKDDMLAKDPWTSKYLNKTSFSNDYNMVPWESLDSFGSKRYLLEVANDNAGTDKNTINRITAGRLKSRLPFNRANHIDVYAEIDMPPMQKEELVTIVNNSVADMILTDIEKVINVLTNPKTANTYMHNVARLSDNVKDGTKATISYLYDVKLFSDVMNCLDTVAKGMLSDNGYSDLKSNMAHINKYMTFMAYTASFNREVTYESALLLPNKMVNPDNYNKFETDGGNQLQISHYLHVRYPEGVSLPVRGLTAESVLKSVKEIDKLISAEQLDIDMKLRKKTISADKTSFTTIVSKFVNELINDDDENCKIDKLNADRVIKNLSTDVALSGIALEDILYKFLINNVYKNKFIYSVYQRLGNVYAKHFKDVSEISTEDLVLLGSSVFTELTIDFIKDRFLIIDNA